MNRQRWWMAAGRRGRAGSRGAPFRRAAGQVLQRAAAVAAALGILLGTVAPAFAERERTYILDKDGLPLTSQVGYIYDWEIDGLYKPSGTFKNPSDLFVDKDGNIWVADTGNNRIVKFDKDGNFLMALGAPPAKENEAEIGPAAEGERVETLNAPEGVFIDHLGRIWVADRGNGRVALFNAQGIFLRDFPKPQSKLLEEDQVYQPSKVVVDRRGYIYVLNGGGDFRGIFLLDADGVFRGFFAANRLDFTLIRLIIRVFTTQAQKKQISKVLPTHHANVFLDEQGFIYAVSPLAQKDQIKKLNPVGNNVFPRKFYGERERRGSQWVWPQFVDVTVDRQGTVSALDFNSGRIYQYDQSGNLLLIFGGRGSQRGKFELPASIAGGPDGSLLVLDANRNNIQIFRRTAFAKQVHTAAQLYYDGRYEDSADVWRAVLRQNSNFELAHAGVGKAYFKRGDYARSMQAYVLARDKNGYSLAYGEWRHEFLRENFGWVLPLAIFSIWLAITLFTRTVRWMMEQTRYELQRGRL